MTKETNNIKKWILRVGLFLLLYPFLEFLTPINLGGQVNRGALTTTVEPLTVTSFLDGTFQESFTNYINDQIGLFGFFVRVHNQLEYSLFGNIFTGNVVAGKDNYLFEQAYIDSYFGKDFIGLEKIERFGGVFKELQDTLASMDKIVVYALATGKANYYPEYLPYTAEKDTTNLEYLVKEFDKRGINYINFTPWFLDMKDTLGDLLFPKYGIHWSYYANVFVADTLVKFIEEKAGWDLPNIHITNMNYSKTTKYFDNDIANSMNLFWMLEPDSMAYPDFVWDKPVGKRKKILLVSDSFGWDLFEHMRLGTDCFEDMDFWFYYQAAHSLTQAQGRNESDLPLLARHKNLYKILNEFDAFVVLSNEPNSISRGWGFPKDALMTLKDSNYVREERGNPYLTEKCLTDKDWREDLQAMANKRGIKLEEMIEIYLHDRNFKLD
jgi:hypothetical protein